MERAKHRKSKSASGIEGIRQLQKQKAVSSLPSHSRSYNDGGNRDAMFMFELGRSSLGGVAGIPMKKLLAEEMSKEFEPKRRSPSVIARLMGLEGLPSPRHVHRPQKRFSDSHQQKNVSVNIQQNSQPHDGRLNRRRSMEQQEFKDVYEDLESSHAVNRRCSSRWSASSILTKPEMALIQQKFIDAKRLSTDEKLQDSKELDDALEMLDSNKDLLLKFLWQPDSLSMKHLHDQQVDPGSSLGSHIAVLKPSNSEKYESKAKAWRSERDISSKHHATSHLKRQDGLLLEPHNRRRAHISHNSTQLEEKDEKKLPTRIVVLKPNLRKTQNAGTSSSSPDLSHDYPPSFKKIKEYPSVRGNETLSQRRKDSSHKMGLSKSMSKEAREIAREITMRMRDGCDETMDAKSTGFRGYIGDESSYDANESDSGSESEMFKLASRKSFDGNNLCRFPSSSLCESSVTREAKKRLSERWKMSHNYQDLEMVSKGSTLGEMLALPDREKRPNHLNVKTNVGRASNRLGRNNGTATWDGPLGISSSDGWKDEISRNSSRSRSLPPYTGGRGRTDHRIMYHDELAEERNLMHSDPVRCGRSKVLKANICHKENSSSKYSKSRNKKPHPCQHAFLDEIDSSSEANFEIQMEANSKDLSEKQPMFQVDARADTCRSPVVDVMMISGSGNSTLSSESSELHTEQLSSVMDGHNSTARDKEASSLQEQHNGPPEQGSPSLQCLGAEPYSSESSKEAEHPSPISVLEVPFTEETSSSESFERVSAELHGLRMQLQLLKMESSTYAEVSTLIPIEEEVVQLSPIISEGNYVLEADSLDICYALDVLIESGLEESDFNISRTTWHSLDCPLDPMLFNNLEKKYIDETTGSRTERRLLFDKINSVLLEIFQEHVDVYPWVMPKLAGLNLKSQKEGIRDALEKLINLDFGDREIRDKVLDRDMQWSDYRGEVDIIGNEIEKLMIDELIIEVLYM